MLRRSLCVVSGFLLVHVLPPRDLVAQEKPSASGNVQQWLRATATGGPTAFEVRWSETGTVGGLEASGTFAPELLQVQVAAPNEEAALVVGRHTLVRDAQGSWRHAHGHKAGVDPALLLLALAAEVTTIAARSVVEREGVVFEQITLCFDGAPFDRLVAAGAIVESRQAKATRARVRAGMLPASQLPAPTVDVCLDVDVASRRVHRVRIRAVSERAPPMGARPGRPAERAEPPVDAEPSEAEALTFVDGLPVRDIDRKSVASLEVVLKDHGAAPAIVLDEAQRRLVGR